MLKLKDCKNLKKSLMIAIPYDLVDAVIRNFDADILKFTTEIKTNLNIFKKDPSLNDKQKNYVEKLLSFSDKIITAKPDEILKYKSEFDGIFSDSEKATDSYKTFKDLLLKKLAYSTRRSDFYPNYFYKIGIKSCVYCNSQLTVCIEEEKGANEDPIYKAKFQVDHYLGKAEYPCFSVSLYNLYPVCGSCNNCKSSKRVSFILYDEKKNIGVSPFSFELEKGSVATYLTSRKFADIKFSFKEPLVTLPTESFQGVFDISGIYETQKDLAEELIIKAEIYTESYKKELKKQFPKLFKSTGIFNRFLIGNYSSEEDIHKRPMTKFTIDIAKQLGLIKGK